MKKYPIQERVLLQFVRCRATVIGEEVVNSSVIAEDVFYLLKARYKIKSGLDKEAYTESVINLFTTYSRSILDPSNEKVLFESLNDLFTQCRTSVEFDTEKSSFGEALSQADAEGYDDADAVAAVASTR